MRFYTYWPRVEIKFKSFFEHKIYFVANRHEYEDYINKQKNKIFGGYRLWTKVLVVNDIKLVTELLNKHSDALHDHIELNTGSSIFSKSVTILMGDDWKRIRAIMAPLFTAHKLKQLVEPLSEVAETMVQELGKQSNLIILVSTVDLR